MKKEYVKFLDDLKTLCEKYRVTLYAAGGIEVYESGYYPGVDDPYFPVIAQVDFDPDEGDNGKAWIDFKKANEKE